MPLAGPGLRVDAREGCTTSLPSAYDDIAVPCFCVPRRRIKTCAARMVRPSAGVASNYA